MLSASAFAAAPSLSARQEAAFFSALRLRNGTFKTTADCRMDDLNEFVIERWREAGFRPTHALDVGASSGISSVEWLHALSKAGFAAVLTATDLVLWAELVPLAPGFFALEHAGHPLQYTICGIGIRPWRRRLDYVTGYALLSGAAAQLAQSCGPHVRSNDAARIKVQLLSKRAVAESTITWAEDDVLAPNPRGFIRSFDAIRAANLLNRDYFSQTELHRAIRNLKERLAGPGSWLIVNRTLGDGSNHATLFTLTLSGGFIAQARFGRGSEVEDIVLGA